MPHLNDPTVESQDLFAEGCHMNKLGDNKDSSVGALLLEKQQPPHKYPTNIQCYVEYLNCNKFNLHIGVPGN